MSTTDRNGSGRGRWCVPRPGGSGRRGDARFHPDSTRGWRLPDAGKPSVVGMLLQILIGVAVIVYLFARRLAGEPLKARRLVVLPAVITIWGASQLRGVHGGLHAADLAFIVVAV